MAISRRTAFVLLSGALLGGGAPAAQAQIGSGWRQDFPTKSLQRWNADRSGPGGTTYSNIGGIETFTMTDADQRCEMKVNNNYTSGIKQFEGWLRASQGQGTSMHQMFKFLMLVYYPDNGGELRQHSYQHLGTTGIRGVWLRVNTIHNTSTHRAEIYINGSLKGTMNDSPPDGSAWYFKYGVYNAGTAGAKAEWRDVKYFTYTGATSPTPSPTPTAGPGPTPTPCSGCTLSGYYRITPRHSGKAVVVQSASTANSANVFQWAYGGTTRNDEWELRSIGSGYYRVINRHSGKDLTVQSASTAEGANIFQYAYGGTTTNDEWAVVSLGSGYYRVTNRHSGKSAEVVGGGTTDGTNVAQRTYGGATHQQFQLVSVP